MRKAVSHPSESLRAGRRNGGFTVIELLVATSILTLIVLVLFSIFDRTQRAMRSNNAQVDVSEGARAALEMISRDLEQMTATQIPGDVNFYTGLEGNPNPYPKGTLQVDPFMGIKSTPWTQPLLPTNVVRINYLQDVFWTSQFNKECSAIGYRILPYTNFLGTFMVNAGNVQIGMLYRFEYSTNVATVNNGITNLFDSFCWQANTNSPQRFQRITDGIVHFRVTAYDSSGLPMTNAVPGTTFPMPDGRPLRYGREAINFQEEYSTTPYEVGLHKYPAPVPREITQCYFTNALPAFVEVELGVLEPQIVERWKSMPNPQMASSYLARQTGKLRLFQQRIPIRSAASITPVPVSP